MEGLSAFVAIVVFAIQIAAGVLAMLALREWRRELRGTSKNTVVLSKNDFMALVHQDAATSRRMASEAAAEVGDE